MRYLLVLVALSAAVFASVSSAQEPARIALLIGNKAYSTDVGPLKNPHNDITLVGDALRAAGFDVMPPVKDANRLGMLRAVRDFADRLAAAGPSAIGVFYYTGHGAAVGQTNYLVPIDVTKPGDASLEDGGIHQRDLINRLLDHAPNAALYFIVDACRNNLGGTKGPKGMAPEARRNGILIAFATEPEKPASDEGDNGGPFARAMAAELGREPQLDMLMFYKVRLAVAGETRGVQVPTVEDGILLPSRPLFGRSQAAAAQAVSPQAAPKAAATSSQPSAPLRSEVGQFCQSVALIQSITVLQALKEHYVGTPMALCAAARIKELTPAPSSSSQTILEISGTRPRGLLPAKIERDTFLMFATQPGMVALDGPRGGNSPFTGALLEGLQGRYLEMTALAQGVRERVAASTDGRQVPSANDGLTRTVDLAANGKKVALVVGASNYAMLPSLANSNNDARAMTESLKRLGFTVQTVLDSTESAFKTAVRDFARVDADTKLLYFSGSGIELNGQNYVAMIDAVQPTEGGFASNRGWVGLDGAIDEIRRTSRGPLIVMLDACRDVPVVRER